MKLYILNDLYDFCNRFTEFCIMYIMYFWFLLAWNDEINAATIILIILW